MIIVRTPLRISLVGGGTDVPAFYKKHGGAVVSMTIDKYVYVSVNDKFDGRTRVSYSVTENVETPKHLKHDLAREALELFDAKGLEIASVSDIPGSGTGLGSSSAFAVGLSQALSYKRNGKAYRCKVLAETAFSIEKKTHAGIGKQDHYAATFGDLHYYEFEPDETVSVEPIFMTLEQRINLESKLLLLYTGTTRLADPILQEQERNFEHRRKSIEAGLELKELAFKLATEMQEGNFDNIGAYLLAGWIWKREISKLVSTPDLDVIFDKAIAMGASGGKLLGAGGGGFFLFYAEPRYHDAICAETGLRRVPFKTEREGSKIIYG